jgi:hypothetical protein
MNQDNEHIRTISGQEQDMKSDFGQSKGINQDIGQDLENEGGDSDEDEDDEDSESEGEDVTSPRMSELMSEKGRELRDKENSM